jgi:hypothetical protein
MPKGIDVNQVSVSKVDKRFIRPPVANYKLGQGELTIVLREAVTLSGRVLLDGEPLVAAVVELDGKDFHEITATDKEGKFSRSIPARAEVKVALTGQFAKPAANGRWEDEFLPIYGEETVAPGATEVTIRARRVPLDRTLVVRVTGPDGSPVDGIRLNMNARGFRAEKPPATDAAGRVELTGLPAGEISVGLAVHRAPVPWALPKTMHAKLVPEGQEVVFAFRTAVPITGVVVLADGTRTKAALTAWRGEEYVAHATGEDDGTFAIYIPADEPAAVRLDAMGLPVGPIDVTKKAPPPSRGEVTGVAPGAEGVTIRLRAAD